MNKLLFLLCFFLAFSSFSQNNNRNEALSKYYFNIAERHIEKLNYSDALINIDKAIKLDSTNYIFYQARGVVNYELGNIEMSKNDMLNATTINFNVIRLSDELTFEKNEIDSKEYFTYFISKFPNEPITYYQRGRINLYLKKNIQSIKDFDNALKLSKDSGFIPDEFFDDFQFFCYFIRGIAKLRSGKINEAVIDFDLALEKPAYGYDTDVNEYKIAALIDLKKYDEALVKVLQFIPQSAENYSLYENQFLFLRGLIYKNIKNYEKSLEDLNKVIEVGGFGRIPAIYHRGLIKFEYLNDLEGAKSDFEMSINKYNSHTRLADLYELYNVNACEPYFDYNDAFNKRNEL